MDINEDDDHHPSDTPMYKQHANRQDVPFRFIADRALRPQTKSDDHSDQLNHLNSVLSTLDQPRIECVRTDSLERLSSIRFKTSSPSSTYRLTNSSGISPLLKNKEILNIARDQSLKFDESHLTAYTDGVLVIRQNISNNQFRELCVQAPGDEQATVTHDNQTDNEDNALVVTQGDILDTMSQFVKRHHQKFWAQMIVVLTTTSATKWIRFFCKNRRSDSANTAPMIFDVDITGNNQINSRHLAAAAKRTTKKYENAKDLIMDKASYAQLPHTTGAVDTFDLIYMMNAIESRFEGSDEQRKAEALVVAFTKAMEMFQKEGEIEVLVKATSNQQNPVVFTHTFERCQKTEYIECGGIDDKGIFDGVIFAIKKTDIGTGRKRNPTQRVVMYRFEGDDVRRERGLLNDGVVNTEFDIHQFTIRKVSNPLWGFNSNYLTARNVWHSIAYDHTSQDNWERMKEILDLSIKYRAGTQLDVSLSGTFFMITKDTEDEIVNPAQQFHRDNLHRNYKWTVRKTDATGLRYRMSRSEDGETYESQLNLFELNLDMNSGAQTAVLTHTRWKHAGRARRDSDPNSPNKLFVESRRINIDKFLIPQSTYRSWGGKNPNVVVRVPVVGVPVGLVRSVPVARFAQDMIRDHAYDFIKFDKGDKYLDLQQELLTAGEEFSSSADLQRITEAFVVAFYRAMEVLRPEEEFFLRVAAENARGSIDRTQDEGMSCQKTDNIECGSINQEGIFKGYIFALQKTTGLKEGTPETERVMMYRFDGKERYLEEERQALMPQHIASRIHYMQTIHFFCITRFENPTYGFNAKYLTAKNVWHSQNPQIHPFRGIRINEDNFNKMTQILKWCSATTTSGGSTVLFAKLSGSTLKPPEGQADKEWVVNPLDQIDADGQYESWDVSRSQPPDEIYTISNGDTTFYISTWTPTGHMDVIYKHSDPKVPDKFVNIDRFQVTQSFYHEVHNKVDLVSFIGPMYSTEWLFLVPAMAVLSVAAGFVGFYCLAKLLKKLWLLCKFTKLKTKLKNEDPGGLKPSSLERNFQDAIPMPTPILRNSVMEGCRKIK